MNEQIIYLFSMQKVSEGHAKVIHTHRKHGNNISSKYLEQSNFAHDFLCLVDFVMRMTNM